MRNVSHKTVVDLHKYIADSHKGIKGFYRFNWSEINSVFRSGTQTPTLLLESHSSELSGNKISNFNARSISFILIDLTGKADSYDKQEEVLDRLEGIGLDICSYLSELNKTKGHWLYGLFDINSFKMQKVGPIFDSMYGWNILYEIKNHEPMCMNTENWDFPNP